MLKPTTIEVISRGLIRQGQYLLACKNTAKGYYYLPGGHIEPNESAAAAIARELVEETGEAPRVGPLLFVCEVFFPLQKRQLHEYNWVFHVELVARGRSGALPIVKSKEKGIAFEWLDQAAVSDLDLRPAVIRAWIASGCATGPGAIGWASVSE